MKFSVIVCTLNSARFLRHNLESLKVQKFRDFEVIVIDGYSTDSTAEIINKYRKYLPIKVFRQKPAGISAAMNFGLSKSKGEWIFYLHADDSLEDGGVFVDIDRAINVSKADILYGQIRLINTKRQTLGVFPRRRIFQLSWSWLLRLFNYIPHQATFVHRDVFNSIRLFDEGISSAMDYDFWLRAISRVKMKYVDRIVASFMVRDDSQSSSSANRNENQQNYRQVRSRYLSPTEIWISDLFERLAELTNPINKLTLNKK